MNTLNLVTNAHLETWDNNAKNLLLGHTCIKYTNLREISKYNYIIAKPYGVDKNTKDADLQLLNELIINLSPFIFRELNNQHNLNYSERFWNIILGHWLRRFFRVCINRISTLDQVYFDFKPSKIKIIDLKLSEIVPLDSSEALNYFNSPSWNSFFYYEILKLKNISINKEIVKVKKSQITIKSNTSLLNQLVIFYNKFAALFQKNTNAFLIGTYLSKIDEFLLQIRLKQFPLINRSPDLILEKEINIEAREYFVSNILKNELCNKYSIYIALLKHSIPTVFLENFSRTFESVNVLPWPTAPKFIYTCNNFDTDELFKFWTAKKVEAKVPYIVGQHGNNYGTNIYSQNSVEEITADKFNTFGWKYLNQHHPFFITKNTVKEISNYDKNGVLLFIQDNYHHWEYTWDTSYQYELFFSDQLQYLQSLSSVIYENTILRLHNSCATSFSDEIDRWRDFDKKINIEYGKLKIIKLISRSRLVVHSYDSTGILETLSKNIPTIAFWRGEFDHLKDDAIPYYKLLYDAGIIHFDSISAAQKTIQIWDNIDLWWFSDIVQNAVNTFCEKYAKTTGNVLKELTLNLKSN